MTTGEEKDSMLEGTQNMKVKHRGKEGGTDMALCRVLTMKRMSLDVWGTRERTPEEPGLRSWSKKKQRMEILVETLGMIWQPE